MILSFSPNFFSTRPFDRCPFMYEGAVEVQFSITHLPSPKASANHCLTHFRYLVPQALFLIPHKINFTPSLPPPNHISDLFLSKRAALSSSILPPPSTFCNPSPPFFLLPPFPPHQITVSPPAVSTKPATDKGFVQRRFFLRGASPSHALDILLGLFDSWKRRGFRVFFLFCVVLKSARMGDKVYEVHFSLFPFGSFLFFPFFPFLGSGISLLEAPRMLWRFYFSLTFLLFLGRFLWKLFQETIFCFCPEYGELVFRVFGREGGGRWASLPSQSKSTFSVCRPIRYLDDSLPLPVTPYCFNILSFSRIFSFLFSKA